MITVLYLLCFLALAQLQAGSSFQLTPSRTPLSTQIQKATHQSTPITTTSLHGELNKDDENDFGNAGGDSYEGDIDWDAEWKKVVEKRDQPSSRPGKYKTDVERALLQTTKATGEQIKKVKIVKPDINIRSLQGDARVCDEDFVHVLVLVFLLVIFFAREFLTFVFQSYFSCVLKFWIAILAIISVGISLISAAGVSTYSNSNDSFYI